MILQAKFVAALCMCAGVMAFSLSRGMLTVVGKHRPLSTASLNRFTAGISGIIPRLEPGLRWLEPRLKFLSQPQRKIKVVDFNLDWLSQTAFDTSRRRSGNTLLASATGSIHALQLRLAKHFRTIATSLLVLISTNLLPMRPAFAAAATPPAIVRIDAKQQTTPTTSQSLLSKLFSFELNLFKFKKYRDLTPTQRLGTTPVFFLANSRGNSYLQADTQAGRPEQKIVTYFLSSEDAADYLNEMTQSQSQVGGPGSAEFRLMSTTLEKALGTVQAKKQSRKLGRYEVDLVHRIQPSSRQYENAAKLTSKAYRKNPIMATLALKDVNVPVFHAPGLVVTRSNGEAVSPYYFAYEDLLEDWRSVQGQGQGGVGAAGPQQLPAEPKVAVYDLTDTLCLADGPAPTPLAADSAAPSPTAAARQRLLSPLAKLTAKLKSSDAASTADGKAAKEREKAPPTVGFVPPRREIEMLRRYYRNQAGFKNEFSKAKYLGKMTSRTTTKVTLPSASIGTQVHLLFHRYGPQNSGLKAYIQASLHADELPGLMVSHHLIHLLEEADKKNLIAKEIVIVPFANPIGLGQNFLGSHEGRFNIATGINFNRNFAEVTAAVLERVDGKLQPDEKENVRIVREAFRAELDSRCSPDKDPMAVEDAMKLHLLREACDADIVLDLHCDNDAVLHMYTHDRLWPQLSDLAALLGSECNIVDPDSGGNCFDEACSSPWAKVADKFPDLPVPMACQSTTVELRGVYDVSDAYGRQDAVALYQFLLGRGYILPDPAADSALPVLPSPLPALKRGATPLTGVDMIKSPVAGVIDWKVKAGDTVAAGQLLGEVVNIEDPFAARTPLRTRTAGFIFGMHWYKLAIPGKIVIKVAGDAPLPWRKGNLLTSR